VHGDDRRVVDRLLVVLDRHAPELRDAHARREAGGEALAVQQPVRLRIAPHERRRQHRQVAD
jgi:hypothetical protein